ncbi:hypothetical protein ABW19_dt0209229 [Dactylella cylindrospora]|nr:hypothetical protein ABW19_dt0209229 [Dactylella cylindrospora]
MTTYISATVMAKDALQRKIAKDKISTTPDSPPSELSGKSASVQIFIRNLTQFEIKLHDSYFYSGRNSKGPEGVIYPFSTMTFSVCNRDWFPTGVTGGNAFRVVLDSNNNWDFAIGWCDPKAGAKKAGVTASSSAQKGYEAATDVFQNIESKKFQGKDEMSDDNITFTLSVSSNPGTVAVYTINQSIQT